MKAYLRSLGLFVLTSIFLGGCSLSAALIKSVPSLPPERDVIINITTVNKRVGWYFVDPTNWKLSKWEFPNNSNSPTPINEEIRRSFVSWSPQSQRLLYALNLVSLNGSVEVLKLGGKRDLTSSWQTLSPNGKTVAYTGESRTDKTLGLVEDISLFDIASRRSQVITKFGAGGVYQITWSPDGKTLAFWHWDSLKRSKTLYQINLDGSNLRVLLEAKDNLPLQIQSVPSDDEKIKWSPDGRYLALTNSSYNSQTIWLLELATKQLKPLFDAPPAREAGGIQDFAWSPDGKKMVLAAGYDGKCHQPLLIGYEECTNFLYLVDVEGGQLTKVTNIPQSSATRLLWLGHKRQP
ncbi:MAG: PD40 domain-containing protein [Symplocastrum torsivum CPER-KK1]|jgi:Tol biopolymer transport system component|uniref:PD40 domain-containing protein n=1 Tax=Symplocastrum torsivum CPER-KK1 TaxID=450513 RepID=A0A951UCG4_9CYAN|nr:PD40 domain-containing protein [Symplocastrum torsivum CPER-KK1]